MQIDGPGLASEEEDMFNQCYKLIRKLRGFYIGSGMGWNAKEKKQEMSQKHMKYIILYLPKQDHHDASRRRTTNIVTAFCSFLEDYEDDLNVVYVYELHVNKGYQRNGYGKHLLNEMIKYATDKNISHIMLTAFLKNQLAIAFYQKNGFGFYDDPGSQPANENWVRLIRHV